MSVRRNELHNHNLMYTFDSVKDMTEFADEKKMVNAGRASFVGERIADWEALLKRVSRDWAEGMYTLQQYIDRLKKEDIPELKSHKRQTKFSEFEGDEVDYDKLFAGQPFWRKTEREAHTGSMDVTVVIDTTTPANKRSEDILWRGAAALALAVILEEKGYHCEIWVVNGSQLFYRESRGIMTSCCLKRGSDTMDVSTLINTVSGWFYRTALFTVLETICLKENKRAAYGYGSCYTPTAVDLDSVTPDELRIYSSGVFSFDAAHTMIVAELQRIQELEVK